MIFDYDILLYEIDEEDNFVYDSCNVRFRLFAVETIPAKSFQIQTVFVMTVLV